jgi:hypothetical protein
MSKDDERMAANSMTIDWSKMKFTESIDWERTFPGLALGPHRDPVGMADSIKADVRKLKSLSEAGQRAIIEERCARAGVSPEGVPTFYIGRTRA